jgi:hypothetical protein
MRGLFYVPHVRLSQIAQCSAPRFTVLDKRNVHYKRMKKSRA